MRRTSELVRAAIGARTQTLIRTNYLHDYDIPELFW